MHLSKSGSIVAFLALVPLALGLSSCFFDKGSGKPGGEPAPNTVEAWQALVQKSPSFENYTSLGLAYTNAGRHQEALLTFKKSLEISPNAPLAENNICAAHNALRQWDQAIPHCRRALELQPNHQIAKNNLAHAERQRIDEDQRIVEHKKQIASGKEVDANRVNLGNLLYGRGSYEEAISIWKEVPKESSHYAVAQNDVASALIQLKRFDEARKSLQEALRLDPNNGLFKNNLAWLNSEAAKQQR
jgi:tetratricopeptide (TPR) repeat protein